MRGVESMLSEHFWIYQSQHKIVQKFVLDIKQVCPESKQMTATRRWRRESKNKWVWSGGGGKGHVAGPSNAIHILPSAGVDPQRRRLTHTFTSCDEQNLFKVAITTVKSVNMNKLVTSAIIFRCSL